VWHKTRAASALGMINGKLRRRLAAHDIPGIIAGIQQLAQAADLIRAEDFGVQQVMANFERAAIIIGQDGSLSQLDATVAACEQAASGTPIPLLRATFRALLGNVLVAKFGKTEQIPDLDAAVRSFQQAADTAPDSNPIRAAYLERLTQLQLARAALAGASQQDEIQVPLQQIAPDGSDRIDQAPQARDPAALTAGIKRRRPALPAPEPSPTPSGSSEGQPDKPAPGKVLDLTDPNHLPPGWTPKQAREMIEFLSEPQTGDAIPMEMRSSRKFRWRQRGLLVFCLASTGNLIYAWLHGGSFISTGDAIVATLGFWLVFLFACFGIVFKRPG
jgi:hypothetical protein